MLDKDLLIKLAYEEGNLKAKDTGIEKYLTIAREHLGKSDVKYLDLNFHFDWCAVFVYYLVAKSGFNISFAPLPGSNRTLGLVEVWYELANLNIFSKHTIPQPGDIVIYNKILSDYDMDHIGVVLENHEDYIIASEGNINNATGIFQRNKNKQICKYLRFK